MNGLIGFNDNFLKIKKNDTYEPRGASFIMKNTGNSEVTLNDGWVLQPCETYGLLNNFPNAVANGSYRVKFGSVNVKGDGMPLKNQLSIAEVHFTKILNSEYAQ